MCEKTSLTTTLSNVSLVLLKYYVEREREEIYSYIVTATTLWSSGGHHGTQEHRRARDGSNEVKQVRSRKASAPIFQSNSSLHRGYVKRIPIKLTLATYHNIM